MTIIQALKDTTTRLEQYDAQLKSGVSHAKAEVILAESEKMNPLLRAVKFCIEKPDLCGKHAYLKEPLNKALSLYARVVQGCIDHRFKACDEGLKACDEGFQACAEKTDKIHQHFMQRLDELEKEIEDVQLQPIVEALEGDLTLLTLPNFPTELLKKIFGSLGAEFLFVLKFTCKKFNNAIQLKKQTDPVSISAQGPVLFSIIKLRDFCDKAALNGHTKLLQWGRANGFPWSETTCASAAGNGHLETLQWARANGCPWNEGTCTDAAENGHLEILQWARANGCPWDAATCAYAALNGHLEILQWARANDCPWDGRTSANAALDGHLETLKWLRANGCPWGVRTCGNAALNGHLEILKWLRANGCSWSEGTCAGAALNGHLQTLMWARENGCRWDETTCVYAAEKGHLETLKWASTNGCPWDARACVNAASNGHLEILQWARANGCPWNEDMIRMNAIPHPEVLKWLDSLEGTA